MLTKKISILFPLCLLPLSACSNNTKNINLFFNEGNVGNINSWTKTISFAQREYIVDFSTSFYIPSYSFSFDFKSNNDFYKNTSQPTTLKDLLDAKLINNITIQFTYHFEFSSRIYLSSNTPPNSYKKTKVINTVKTLFNNTNFYQFVEKKDINLVYDNIDYFSTAKELYPHRIDANFIGGKLELHSEISPNFLKNINVVSFEKDDENGKIYKYTKCIINNDMEFYIYNNFFNKFLNIYEVINNKDDEVVLEEQILLSSYSKANVSAFLFANNFESSIEKIQ